MPYPNCLHCRRLYSLLSCEYDELELAPKNEQVQINFYRAYRKYDLHRAVHRELPHVATRLRKITLVRDAIAA